MTTRFTRRGVAKIYFCATAANPVTRPNIAAGTDLTSFIADMSGWNLENQPIPTPDMGSDFESSIPGTNQAGDSSFTFYEDLDAETLDTLLPKDTSGVVVIMRKGDKPTSHSLDRFEVRVASKSPEYSAGNDPAREMVRFTITKKPDQDLVVPAA